jgi:tetratricopeptide (TPR) repeat protein
MRRGFVLGCIVALLADPWGMEGWLIAVRRGNRAYHGGDYATALKWYDRAGATTDDPGLVAFCRAAALFQLGRFSDAESAYRQALEDAQGWRRAAALYGLGNSLARQGEQLGGRQGTANLAEAIQVYQECLDACESLVAKGVEQLKEDAAHNLRQAEILLQQRRHSEQNGPKAVSSPSDPRPPPDPQNQEPSGKLPTPTQEPPAPGQTPRETSETRPGRGNLPPLLDDLSAPPLTSASAHQYLERHLERIVKERTQRRRARAWPTSEGRDW